MSTGRSLPVKGLSQQERLAAEALNELTGAKGAAEKRALRVEDLVALGLVRTDSGGRIHKTEAFDRVLALPQTAVTAEEAEELRLRTVAMERRIAEQSAGVSDLDSKLRLTADNNDLLLKRLEGERKNNEDLQARIANNEKLSEMLRKNSETVHESIGAVLESVGSVDSVPHGEVYGRPANLDLQDYDPGTGTVRRIGLRVPGGQRIADQRNLPQSNTTSYGAIRNTTALSADSAGNVSVNAHEVKYGAATVSYSAVVNAVTGLTVDTTYIIYCYDADYQGGVRTWFAGINPLDVMDLGDDVVVAGQITIPTSGSSGGGGGGGGDDPENWCVDWDAVLPDGRYVRDLRLGDLVECIDVTTGEIGMFPLQGMGFGEEDCFELTTPSLATVIQSRSTKMDLPDGRVLPTEEMFGKPVYEKVDGEIRLAHVSDLRHVGVRRVCKPDLGNRMFFAGTSSVATIATHNIMWKP